MLDNSSPLSPSPLLHGRRECHGIIREVRGNWVGYNVIPQRESSCFWQLNREFPTSSGHNFHTGSYPLPTCSVCEDMVFDVRVS